MKLSPYIKVTIIGMNGWGKTTLCKHYLEHTSSLIVLDPKWEITLPNALITQNPRDMLKYRRVIYRPPLDCDPVEAGDQAGGVALKRTNTCLWIDEAAIVSPGQRIGRNLRAAIVMGRSKNVGIWAATQRPKDVHNLLFSEAWAYFVSGSLIETDEAKVNSFVSGYAGVKKVLKRFEFYCYMKGENEGKIIRVPPNRASVRG